MTELFDTNLSYSALELFLKFYYFSSFHMLICNLVLLYKIKQLLNLHIHKGEYVSARCSGFCACYTQAAIQYWPKKYETVGK